MNAATTVGGAVQTRPRSLGYRPALDGIRAVAILAVMGFHGGTPLVGGFIGVDIFFVLSGFLITTLLLQEWSRTRRIRLGDFYLRRARRLLPALFVTIAGVGVIYAIDPDLRTGVGFAPAAAAVAFYVGNWVIAIVNGHIPLGLLDHTWSLAIEEQFYILWPPLLLLCLRRSWQPRRLLALALILSCASAALRAVLWAEHIGPNVYFRSDTRADGLLLGCALAAVYSTEAGRRLLQRCIGSWVASVIAAVVLLGFGLTVSVSDRFVLVGGLSLVAVCSAVLIAHVVMAERSWVTRTLGFSTLAWIGARSYGMYLFHIPIFSVCVRVLDGQPIHVVLPTEIALTMLAAAASYRWIESYFLRRSRHPAGAPPHVQRFSEEGEAEWQEGRIPAPESIR